MNTDALLLVVAGAFLHAVWNFFAKKASGGIPFIWLYGLVSLVCAIPFGLYAWLQAPQALGPSAWAAIAASAAVHVVYGVVLQKGYQQSDFSVVYPIARGTGPMMAVVGAILVLGEMPSLLGWSGIASIMLGILLIAGVHRLFHISEDRLRKGVMWGTLTGITIAVYTVIDGWAVKSEGLSPLVYYVLGLALRTALLAPVALRAPHLLHDQWRRHRPYIIAVGVLSPLAYTLVLYAMTRAPLSFVAPVRELSMLLGTLFGARLLQEKGIVLRITGAAFMLAGVVMLARA